MDAGFVHYRHGGGLERMVEQMLAKRLHLIFIG
jgi:hypothetical protein